MRMPLIRKLNPRNIPAGRMRGQPVIAVRRLSDHFGVFDPAGIHDHVVGREPVDDPIRAVEEGVAVVNGRRLRDLGAAGGNQMNVPLPICLANPRRAFVLHDLLGGLEFPDRDVALRSMGDGQVRHLSFRNMNMDRVLSVLMKFMFAVSLQLVPQEQMGGMVLVLRQGTLDEAEDPGERDCGRRA